MKDTKLNIQNPKELEFALFCIDFVAQELAIPPQQVYQKLLDSGLLQDYIIANYEVLHTLSKDYLIKDIIQIMREKEVL
ncbi:DUF3791 domain-containing protein [Pelistega suis]|uniref:DUF3791 domain-containing protein n=1 Tax=Pelistega suis TaxID=1631957 RepID=UPI00211BBCA5|nr:DUF3791 domain-containing protein [Pelistega suis]MCQ9329596.1 DUF3791 domain-containing protein [Pelistega suis]